MQATSIHLEPCKVQSSEEHNLRKKANLKHVRHALTDRNEWWSSVSSLSELCREIRQIVKEKTGRTMQKKAQPLYEGVVVIKEDTTMEQLKEIGRQFADRWGITLVQASIQRDEGAWKNSKGELPVDENGKKITDPNITPADPDFTWHPNFHAHLVFDYYNHETGRSCKVPYKIGAEEMQTICAQVLGMERGIASGRKHLDAMAYKAHLEHGKLESLEEERKRQESEKERLLQAKEEAKKELVQVKQETDRLGLKNSPLGGPTNKKQREVIGKLIQEQAAMQQEHEQEKAAMREEHKREMTAMQERHEQENRKNTNAIAWVEHFLKIPRGSIWKWIERNRQQERTQKQEQKTQVQTQAKHRGLGM